MASKVITFTRPLIFEFEGNIYKNAITLGDVDNDGLNELIVGNDQGDLAIFKGENPKPVRLASDLGLITCTIVGDLINLGRNVLLVVTSCGSCYVYDFHQDPIKETDEKKPLKPAHFQKLPANIKMALIADIDGDGFCEVVVALTDRIVRTYKWVDSGRFIGTFPDGQLIGQNKWELSDQIGGIALNGSDGSQTLLVSQPGGTCFTLKPPAGAEVNQNDDKTAKLLNKMSIEFESLDSTFCDNPKIQTEICGDIELEEDDSFAQFRAASSTNNAASSNSFMESDLQCAQEEGTAYVLATVDGKVMLVRDRRIIWKSVLDHPIVSVSQLLVPHKEKRCSFQEYDNETDDESDDSSEKSSPPAPMPNFPISIKKTPVSKSVPVVRSAPTTPSKLTIAIPNSKPKRISNSKKFGQPLVTKIVVCSQDGSTFIMNVGDGSFSQFNFHDSVCGCTSGFFGYRGKQASCIVYASYTNEIFLYHDVSCTLEYKPKLMDLLKGNLVYVEALRKLGVDIEDMEQVRKLNRYLMYGYDCKFVEEPLSDS